MTHHAHIKIATALTHLLENQFRVGKFRFGLDPVLGIIPGFGDAISLLLSFYIVGIAIMMRLPNDAISKMISNIMIDFLIGLIPILGDVTDVVYKANTKNLRLLEEHSRVTIVEGAVV